MDDATDETQPKSRTKNLTKWIVLVIVVAASGFIYFRFGDDLDLKNLASKETELRAYQAEHPVLVYAIAALIYVTTTALSVPGATVLTLVFGWYFGFLRALILVSFASTGGATLAFLLSRYLLRDFIQARFGSYLDGFNKALEEEGIFYLFTLRLMVVVPFFVINAVMGLTPLRARTFWWVSQIGMLPGTAVYVYAGSSIPNPAELADKGASEFLPIILALFLLGCFPLVAKFVINKYRRSRSSTNDANME